jgi:predicted AAA+ superfamily ATPase
MAIGHARNFAALGGFLQDNPVMAFLGPRQCGKITPANFLAKGGII